MPQIEGLLCLLRPLVRDDIELVRKWRNSPHVRANFPSDEEISRDMHELWFQKISGDPSSAYFIIIDIEERPVGLIWLMDIDKSHRHAEFGLYIGNRETLGSGIAIEAELLILEYAFKTLQMNKVYCESLSSNSNALGIHNRMGFTQDGLLRQHALKDQEFHDMVLMSILASEYQGAREAVMPVIEALAKR